MDDSSNIYAAEAHACDLHRNIMILEGMVSGRGTGRALTFGTPHLLKTLQMLRQDRYVSRASLSRELRLGEGSIRTLLTRLAASGMAGSVRSGAHLTRRGEQFAQKFLEVITGECAVPRSSLFDSPYNHAIILRGRAHAIRSGIEQRDYAIMYGARSAVTMLYGDGGFVFPRGGDVALSGDAGGRRILERELAPRGGDAVIVASSGDALVSELSAKNSALQTVSAHGRHYN